MSHKFLLATLKNGMKQVIYTYLTKYIQNTVATSDQHKNIEILHPFSTHSSELQIYLSTDIVSQFPSGTFECPLAAHTWLAAATLGSSARDKGHTLGSTSEPTGNIFKL